LIRRSCDGGRPRAVLLDFDGTASVCDVGATFLGRFARDDSWRVIDDDYETGRIGSRAAYRIAARLLTGTPEDWSRFAREIGRLDPGLGPLVALAVERGWLLEILSDGLGFYIRELLEAGGLRLPVRSNELAPGAPGEGRPAVTTPFVNPRCGRCGTCKTERVESLVRGGFQVVYVGDGYSDLCAAPRAHVLFAKDVLARHCEERGIPFAPFESLHDVARALARRDQPETSAATTGGV
jgi:HAD superfamily phosphoserine phosphatase-like hydrolase